MTELDDSAPVSRDITHSMDEARSTRTESPEPRLGMQFLEAGQRCWQQYWDTQLTSPLAMNSKAQESWQHIVRYWCHAPDKFAEVQTEFWHNLTALWHSTTSQDDTSPELPDKAVDKRFRGEDWQQQPLFAFIHQAYLLFVSHTERLVTQAQGLDVAQRSAANFYTQRWLNALSPSNFALTNPEVLRLTQETDGQSLFAGLKNMLSDLEQGRSLLDIAMTDKTPFVLGETLATTPGHVIYQNRVMQLIHYTPSTETTYAVPLLIIPPWINKYYIFDLQEKNSFVRWLLAQGHAVFMISWVNPTAEHRDIDFEDYLTQGVLAALDAIENAFAVKKINTLGFCIGGTLQGCALAHLAAKRDQRVASATYLTSLLDFSEPGDLGVFVDETQLAHLEQRMQETGYLDGHEMARVFRLLRDNDLVWSYYVSHYLRGETSLPLDLLYWNTDVTHLPAVAHSFYLRETYLHNHLREPDGVTLAGTALDLRKITQPVYFLSTEQDHIAPWRSTYQGAQLHAGPVTFVLGGSGHIAGIINPPDKNKYNYRTAEVAVAKTSATVWLAKAETHRGSWWPHWANWLQTHSGEQVSAYRVEDSRLTPIEPAPGSYVTRDASGIS